MALYGDCVPPAIVQLMNAHSRPSDADRDRLRGLRAKDPSLDTVADALDYVGLDPGAGTAAGVLRRPGAPGVDRRPGLALCIEEAHPIATGACPIPY